MVCEHCGKRIVSWKLFKCYKCRKIFCVEHILPNDHNCSATITSNLETKTRAIQSNI
ncbi:MAG: AN1-type zinc finger domain-containing protein [Methanosarcina sp.]